MDCCAISWDCVVGSRATRYSRDRFCNSEMLVGLDKGKCLDFRTPLIIPRGETVEFYVQPLTFRMPIVTGNVTVGGTRFFVNFIGFGDCC